MALVSYSDSEASDDEQVEAPKKAPTPPPPSTTTTKSNFNSIVDRSNPRKIRVNLAIQEEGGNTGGPDGEPAPKRARVGGGAFTGFNSMLPAPKRTALTTNGANTPAKGAPRKVFSLKTGAEPGFDRSGDAELRQMFAEQAAERQATGNGSSESRLVEEPKPATPLTTPSSEVKPKGNSMMFKPLSVARNPQKKKKPPTQGDSSLGGGSSTISPRTAPTQRAATGGSSTGPTSTPAPAIAPVPAPKVSLFSMSSESEGPSISTGLSTGEYEPIVYSSGRTREEDAESEAAISSEAAYDGATTGTYPPTGSTQTQPQTLASIASDLNLSASAQRQLFGRQAKGASSSSSTAAAKIIHFNTDAEYAANEAMRASGEAEANQHRSVRAVAPGKHSLKQLINSVAGQADALEESFATGRRNKKEAGGRYGW